MKNNLTANELIGSYTASNHNRYFADLLFERDGVKLLIRNVPAPKNWNREDDWTTFNEYLNSIIQDMDVEIL